MHLINWSSEIIKPPVALLAYPLFELDIEQHSMQKALFIKQETTQIGLLH